MRAAGRTRRADPDATATVRRGVVHAEIVDEARVAGTDIVLSDRRVRDDREPGLFRAGYPPRRRLVDCAVLAEQFDEETPREMESVEVASERDRRLALADAR
ncbi:hypothetical protein [Salinigranum salinum]|uniref:hypothetical protein n=1 Tax=Salinigranum salinum TaxID=1364937 RepID=UPI0012604FA9|nr:hypothetical protein [Salinigranum salinum]